MKAIHNLFAVVVLAGCAGQAVVAPRPASKQTLLTPAEAAETITPDAIHRHIAYLASDALRGRNTPSPGLDSAAAYAAREFQQLGLRPAGEAGGYIQQYALQRRALNTEATRLRVVREGRATTLEHGADFFATAGAPAEVRAGLVFAGKTIEPAAGALRDQAVVTYNPGPAATREFERATRRLLGQATEAGAAALVVVLDPQVPASDIAQLAELSGRPRGLAVGELRDLPVFFLSYQAAQGVFRAAGLNLDQLREQAAGGAMAPVALQGSTIEAAAPARLVEDHRAPNVVAVLPGSDPALRDTYVVFSAHMDHVGVGRPDAAGDSIYNGADDNASGTSALLAVARAFAALPKAPARSLLFLAVSGEEKGLLGSRYFSDHPTVPVQSIVANINVDMIGRNAPDSIVVIGQEYSSLGPLVQEVAAANPQLGLTVAQDMWPQERFFFRSDHFNFARKDIPALFFFAGVHEDYHRPSDQVEKIDTDKTARVARLIFLTSYEIASRPEAPRWTEQGLREVRALTGAGR